jgi:hypothetical protein
MKKSRRNNMPRFATYGVSGKKKTNNHLINLSFFTNGLKITLSNNFMRIISCVYLLEVRLFLRCPIKNECLQLFLGALELHRK